MGCHLPQYVVYTVLCALATITPVGHAHAGQPRNGCIISRTNAGNWHYNDGLEKQAAQASIASAREVFES